LCCNKKTVAEYAAKMNLDINISDNYAVVGNKKCEILECDTVAPVHFGKTTLEAGTLALEQLERAISSLSKGKFDALVTMPVSKAALQLAGWEFPGQTEMLAARFGGEPLMILATGNVRVALQTIHIPISNITSAINQENIYKKIIQFNTALKMDFEIKHPKIAVLGLNPHAGEAGHIGKEEIDIISPAIIFTKNMGIEVFGPFPADGFFAFGDYLGYDGILAMYHDQGLIPLKLLAHGGGVNITAGLSAVRISPDHGTAFGIAGLGKADSASTKETLQMAVNIAKARKQYDL
jgi:4-hydroxythreonine-4-phosphate dehydrogenase